mgnify:CR=1 FL=1
MVKYSEIFKQFTGTGHYYPVGKYAYTDGIHYLQQKLNNNKVFFEFFELVSNLLNFKDPFLSINVTIEKDNFNIHVTDGNYKILGNYNIKLDKEDKELEGTYNIFMYNYVMLAASEY